LILVQIKHAGTEEDSLMPHAPTPDEAEHAIFLIRWWKEFFLGGAAFLGIVATIRKGQKTPIVAAMTETQIDLKLMNCKTELKNEITTEFKTVLENHETRMLENLKLVIENAILTEKANGG